MGDLQGSFWTSGLADAVVTSASSLAAMLDDPEACTLAAVLADNDVIQECKSLNKALNDLYVGDVAGLAGCCVTEANAP